MVLKQARTLIRKEKERRARDKFCFLHHGIILLHMLSDWWPCQRRNIPDLKDWNHRVHSVCVQIQWLILIQLQKQNIENKASNWWLQQDHWFTPKNERRGCYELNTIPVSWAHTWHYQRKKMHSDLYNINRFYSLNSSTYNISHQ